MWERLKFAFSLFFRILNDPLFARRLRKTLSRNMEALAESARATERSAGAVRLLAVLQREGRLIDFLREDISGFPDDAVGAAARNIHTGCSKAVAKMVSIEKVMDKPEGASVTITEDQLDPSAIRLIGDVGPRPPYKGALRHHGWKASGVDLPNIPDGQNPDVLAPAEVEVGA
jgi:hypothetical protein